MPLVVTVQNKRKEIHATHATFYEFSNDHEITTHVNFESECYSIQKSTFLLILGVKKMLHNPSVFFSIFKNLLKFFFFFKSCHFIWTN